ncbi:MAG TPA: sigma-70 family RNA polymerase sigma factor [Candidatus Aminicenantes bacterium]|nr:sigma-70 family RNA polymerase sigma factor [Candidatus Aminicenantes bacterium]
MDDEQLFARLRAGDPLAQREMIRLYTPRIFVYFRNRIKGEDHYEDLVQDVFAAFFNGLDQGKLAGPAWIAPYLFGIAKRVLYNYYYRQRKNSDIQRNIGAVSDLCSNFTELERLETESLRGMLNAVIAGLPRIDRQILRGFYLLERKIGEISEQTGRSRHYISVRKERALKRIRAEILRRNSY